MADNRLLKAHFRWHREQLSTRGAFLAAEVRVVVTK
jgi:hypothetical protein